MLIEWQDFPRSTPGRRVTPEEAAAPAPYTGGTGLQWYCHADGARLYPSSPLDSVLRGTDILTAWQHDYRCAGYGVSVLQHTALCVRLAWKILGWSPDFERRVIRILALHEGGEAVVKDQITMTKRALPDLSVMDDEWTIAIAAGAGLDWFSRVLRTPRDQLSHDDRYELDWLTRIDRLALAVEMTLRNHHGRWDIPEAIWMEPDKEHLDIGEHVLILSSSILRSMVWSAIWEGMEPPSLDYCFCTGFRRRQPTTERSYS